MQQRLHNSTQANHQRGFSMTESLVAATMLLAMTNLSANFFTKSSHQFQQASLRDSVNALIEQDLEAIRSQVAQWHANQDQQRAISTRRKRPAQAGTWPLPC